MDWMILVKAITTILTFAGALAVMLGLPGTFLAWLAVSIYALASRFIDISAWMVLGTFIGCSVIELADNLLSGILVKRFGAGKGSMLMTLFGGIGGAIVGGIVGSIGGFFGSALFSLIGAFGGSYVAVYSWERYRHNRPHSEALRAALGTVVGRLLGMFVKLGWIGWLLSLIW